METGSFTPSLAVLCVGAVERHLSGKKRAARVPLSAPSSLSPTAPPARQDCGHVAGSDRRTEPNLKHARDGARFTARQPSRSQVSRRAQRCQCSPLRFDPAGPAGPTGIDSACARHVMGNCAMAYLNGFGPSASGALTRGFLGRILIHRVCAARHILRFAPSACGARFRSWPTGSRFKRTPNIAVG